MARRVTYRYTRSVDPHVIVVGGGFGGLYAARELARQPLRVTVIDRHNYHLFQPLLYQVATAGLSAPDIASPIRGLLSRFPNVEVRLDEVTQVDLASKKVQLRSGIALDYDSLVVATGATHSYFGHPEWERDARGLKSIDDALELRRRVLLAFETAEVEPNPLERQRLLTFVVVGGGPTGVELAGALGELSRFTFRSDFRHIDPRQARIVLVEAGPRLLAAFDARLAEKAKHSLERLGVEVKLDTRVTQVSEKGVQLGDAMLPAHTVMWAAGVQANPLGRTLGVPVDKLGRVFVNEDLTVPGHAEAYVIGDLAAFKLPDGDTLPGLAPVAMQQARHAARNIAATREGKRRTPFAYFDKGIMATIGRSAGIAQTKGLRLSGFIGWLAWLFIHILYLIGFRNRVLVLFQWAWAFLTFQRGARVITGDAQSVEEHVPVRVER
jgi:NADH dehydrogenase